MDLRNLFEERGIIFRSGTESEDARKIQEIGYYKLKSFASPFANVDGNGNLTYKDLKFKDLLSRYYQDKKLRIYLFHALEDIEVYLNNVIANVLGRYGAYGYLDFKNWCDRSLTPFKIEKAQYLFKKELLRKVGRSGLPDLKKPSNISNDGFPIVWLMTDCLTLGDSVHIFLRMSPSNKQRVANRFHCSKKELESWLNCINFVRNQCVHNENLIDLRLKTKPILPNQYKNKVNVLSDGKLDNDKIASVTFIIKFMVLQVNNKYQFKNVYAALCKLVSNYSAQSFGFKNDAALKCLQ